MSSIALQLKSIHNKKREKKNIYIFNSIIILKFKYTDFDRTDKCFKLKKKKNGKNKMNTCPKQHYHHSSSLSSPQPLVYVCGNDIIRTLGRYGYHARLRRKLDSTTLSGE